MVEKERTFRGKRPNWRTDLKRKIVSLLVDTGGMTFTKIFEELKKLPEDLRPGSYETLSELLKELYEEGEVEQEPFYPRRWEATPAGAFFARAGEKMEKFLEVTGKEARELDPDQIVYAPRNSVTKSDVRYVVQTTRKILHKMMPQEERKKYFGDEKELLKNLKKMAPDLCRAWRNAVVHSTIGTGRILEVLFAAYLAERARVRGRLPQKQEEQLCRMAEALTVEQVRRLLSDLLRRVSEEPA